MNYVKLSKEVSYALRHAPWEYELELDDAGFVPMQQLLTALNDGGSYNAPVTQADIEGMIVSSEKQRHEIVSGKIRAIYGHSIPRRVSRTAANPPTILYHGTSHRALNPILKSGLEPMDRQYVHLSVDIETATSVGMRKDKCPVILQINAHEASEAGVAFYKGNDKVWLADNVPAKYISMVD